jgi:transglutaminase-like putative cysteine protease
MTAGSLPQHPAGDLRPRAWDTGRDDPGMFADIVDRLRPDEGWLSLPLAMVLTGTMAWSIADARWILGRDDLTSFVIWIALAATAWGYISARLDIAPWLAQVTGALLGAFVLIEVVGTLVPLPLGATPGLSGWFQATAYSISQAYLDLTWRHMATTGQYGHFCLIIGVIVWGTAQAASYDIFGYHRSINGILLMSIVLLANMTLLFGAAADEQLPALVLFSGAGLWLLLKAHASDERTGWLRHRIWRGGDLRAPRAQGGFGFAAGAVCGALILTTVASSAPLQNAMPGLDQSLRDFANSISGYLPSGKQSRFNQGADFGTSTAISSSFNASAALVMTISEVNQTVGNTHWRVIAYSNFKSNGWTVDTGAQTAIAAGGSLNAGTLDAVDKQSPGRAAYAYTVHLSDTTLRHLVIASEPGSVNTPVTRLLVGSLDQSDVVWFAADAATYTVSSFVPNENPLGNGLTEWQLRQAGSDYSPQLLERYLQGADLVGSSGQAMLHDIEAWAATQGVALDPKTHDFTNAYDAAKSIQEFMRSPDNFTYDANISDLASKCSSLSTVDCFVQFRRGFCEQYATTMTMLMRMAGFPARYVEGYLSGPISQASRAIQITGQQRHAWVEVYFPKYGWIPFDPTGGTIGQPTELPAGVKAAASPTPSVGPISSASDVPDVTPRRPGGPIASQDTGSSPLGGLALPGLITVLVLLALFTVWRRRPRRLDSPDSVYRSIVRVASRLGYKPSPTQTVYEYTGMLAAVVPRAREPLDVVATAQVEVVYGRRNLPTDRLMSLAAAQRRVRQALLRLIFRIPGRGPKSKPKGPAGRA